MTGVAGAPERAQAASAVPHLPAGVGPARCLFAGLFVAVALAYLHSECGRPRWSLSLACLENPVSRILMSGLLRGIYRWPSWMFACVSGANLFGVLEAHDSQRLRL